MPPPRRRDACAAALRPDRGDLPGRAARVPDRLHRPLDRARHGDRRALYLRVSDATCRSPAPAPIPLSPSDRLRHPDPAPDAAHLARADGAALARARARRTARCRLFADGFGNSSHMHRCNRPVSGVRSILVEGRSRPRIARRAARHAREPLPPVFYPARHRARPQADAAIARAGRARSRAGRRRLDAAACAVGMRCATRARLSSRADRRRRPPRPRRWPCGEGVCQDHAHVCIAACARALGYPARYVCGYLLDRRGRRAARRPSHAWAEVLIRISAGSASIRPTAAARTSAISALGVGLRLLRDAAPIRGISRGGGARALDVTVRVVRRAQQ